MLSITGTGTTNNNFTIPISRELTIVGRLAFIADPWRNLIELARLYKRWSRQVVGTILGGVSLQHICCHFFGSEIQLHQLAFPTML